VIPALLDLDFVTEQVSTTDYFQLASPRQGKTQLIDIKDCTAATSCASGVQVLHSSIALYYRQSRQNIECFEPVTHYRPLMVRPLVVANPEEAQMYAPFAFVRGPSTAHFGISASPRIRVRGSAGMVARFTGRRLGA
jgi:hypothetical protein